MKSNLSKCKVGEDIATLMWGWVKIINTNANSLYSINLIVNKQGALYDVSLMSNGCLYQFDEYPIAFTEEDCPEWLLEIIGPKPCKFKKGDRVLCNGNRRYFSHENGGKYYCFCLGADEWGSNGDTMGWDKDKVKPWEDE